MPLRSATSARGSRVFVPPVRRYGVLLPAGLEHLIFAAVAVALTLTAWAVFSASPVSNGNPYQSVPLISPAQQRSVAYIAPAGGSDALYVRAIGEDGPGTLLGLFPSSFNLHARGLASPLGDAIALLSVSPSTSPLATLSLVALPLGSTREGPGSFDYLSPMAWSQDGGRVALRRSTPADEAGRVSVSVFEVDVMTFRSRSAAVFENVYEAAPVGYSLDGKRLFIVVIDQSGSSLWAERDGRTQRIASLSPGRTRDWSLSPDGARLAFVDILGVGERSYAGRSLVVATGGLTSAPPAGNQIGAVWLPGSQAPLFGGPGGSVQLSDPPQDAAYVVPAQWSPDGSTLAATIYSASSGRQGSASRSIELVTPERRVVLADQEGAAFLGWVRDLH